MLVQGVGVNDADYEVFNRQPDGSIIRCPYYVKWMSMIRRCYSKKVLDRQEYYNGCIVCDEWLTFSKFKEWMQRQDWQGKDLDKDLLFKDNKVYGPDTCTFITRELNSFITDSKKSRGKYKIGVTKEKNRYVSRISENGKSRMIGRFSTEDQAYEAWYKRKRELAIELSFSQTDNRIIEALLSRFP